MIERDVELSELDAALGESVSGGLRVVVVRGVAAIGKTALIDEFADRVRGKGVRLLRASGAPTESDLSLGIVRQLLAGEDFDGGTAATVGGLLDHQLLAAAASDGVSRSRVLDGLAAAVLELTAQHPVVIAIDDAQHLDAFSQHWLVYLTRRAAAARLLIVLGWRDDLEMSPADRCLLYTDFYPRAYCRRLELAMLSPAGVAGLLAERLPAPAAATLAPAVHAFTGGNPLLVRAFAEDTRAQHGQAAEPVAGTEVERAVLIVLHRCDPVTLRVAAGIAVLDEPARPELLARLTGVTPGRVVAAAEVLDRIGLADGGRMRHPATAATVLNALSATDRAELHWRCVKLLKATGADALGIAGHLVASGRLDETWAVPILVEGAEQALQAGRVRRAIELLRLAYQVDGDEQRRVGILATLVRVEWRVNPSCVLSHLSELNEAASEGRLGSRDAAATGLFLAIHGRAADAGAVLSRGATGSLPGSRADQHFEVTRSLLAILYPGVFRQDPEPPAGPPVGIGHRMVEHYGRALDQWPGNESLSHAQRLLQQQPLTEMSLLPLMLALRTLVYAERLDEADRQCRALMQAGLDQQAPTWHAMFCGVAAEIALRRGALVAAETHAFTALELIPAADWGVFAGLPISVLLTAQTLLGKHEEATTTLALPVPHMMFETHAGLCYLLARGRHHLECGLPEAAMEDFRAVGELLERWGADRAGLLPWRTELAAAYLKLGDRASAARYAEEQLRRMGPGHLRVHGRTLRLLAATRDLRFRPPVLREAVDILHRSGDRFELVAALTALHDTYTRLGQTGRARSVARKANSIAQAGQSEWGAPSPVPSPATAVREIAADVLSDAERRVAELAARGHTNREIAGKLYVTASTVEQHLTRIYRKLGVGSRMGLQSRLGPELAFPGPAKV